MCCWGPRASLASFVGRGHVSGVGSVGGGALHSTSTYHNNKPKSSSSSAQWGALLTLILDSTWRGSGFGASSEPHEQARAQLADTRTSDEHRPNTRSTGAGGRVLRYFGGGEGAQMGQGHPKPQDPPPPPPPRKGEKNPGGLDPRGGRAGGSGGVRAKKIAVGISSPLSTMQIWFIYWPRCFSHPKSRGLTASRVLSAYFFFNIPTASGSRTVVVRSP